MLINLTSQNNKYTFYFEVRGYIEEVTTSDCLVVSI